MTITPPNQLTEVTRTVTPASQGHVVSLSQTVAAHPEELWSALTNDSRLALWFGRARGELVEGGRYELPDMDTSGRVRAVEEPHRLLLTWEFGTGSNEFELLVDAVDPARPATAPARPEAASAAASGIDVAAQPVPAEEGGARFTLRHTVPADAHWQAFGPAATGCGWDAAMYALALHLEDPSADLLPRLSRFAASPEGADFTRATADAWFRAHVASGADKKPARRASVRTAAFYLGEEPEPS